ncbi:MAG: alanine--tRNA ligase [Cyanobacteria bacterium P01_H01_bin.15]
MSPLPSLSGNEIRQRFLEFFAERQHKVLPSASLVPEDPTVLLTIAGMLPFKPIFLGQQAAPQPRATTSQKCIRTNDIENVGVTKRHHTFFEMLGNFSFGDYFKSQAIAWAWELSTKIYQLPPEQIVVSVFREDDEAFALWRNQEGVPEKRIVRMGEEDNFWASGPTGPCGPCSELYFDFHPERGDDNIDLEDDTRFIEFYNLVFMQYNRDADGNLTPLKNRNIDTGMGLERMAQILQGVPNNYETDLIFPIIEKAASLGDIKYAAADAKTQIALKVIGDHVRAVVHMISDGITASNTGRGYIMRRLLRRVVRNGRLLGIQAPFVYPIAQTAIALSENAYPAVREREDYIRLELEREETAFLKTLERGEKLLAEVMVKAQSEGKTEIGGFEAFDLYTTYGFPVELIQEITAEKGLTVDLPGFQKAMEEHIAIGSKDLATIDLTAQSSLQQAITTLKTEQNIEKSSFVGYTQASLESQVQVLIANGEQTETASAGADVQIVLDTTPFYAESGGQIGDRGFLLGNDLVVRINDVQKHDNLFFVHHGHIERGELQLGQNVTAQIDWACRRRAQANHTATHLLQSALKNIVDSNVSQAGSLVSFDRLRFDFNCPRALTPEEVQQVEDQVNTWVAESHGAEVAVMPIAEAKAKGAVAMFGEKYGAEVRVVDYPGVSMELCGGTHVENTAEIGGFKIISETGISSGVRRIEAVAGPAILDYLKVRDEVVKNLCDRFKAKPDEVIERIEGLQTELKSTQKELAVAKQELALAKSDRLLDSAEVVGEFKVLVANLGEIDADALKTAAERLQQKLGASAVVLGSVPAERKVSLVAAFAPEVHKGKKLPAGKFIGGIAKLCGGGGGGRPNLAQAGGRDPSKLEDALVAAKEQLHATLG